MAGKLSISRAWDETKARVASDGKLMVAVALALIALPSAIVEFAMPGTGGLQSSMSFGQALATILVTLIGIVGQLAIIRLALGPSVSVGEAIAHGARRAPAYLGSVILLILGLTVIALPLVGLFVASGASFEPGNPPPPMALLVFLVLMIVAIFFAVRMLMTSPVASAERSGPIEIIRRSWRMTAGHWWRLFGFIILFVIAILIAITAVGLIASLVARLAFGEIEPMSASALIVALVVSIVSAIATTLFVVMLARIYVQLSAGSAETSVPSTED